MWCEAWSLLQRQSTSRFGRELSLAYHCRCQIDLNGTVLAYVKIALSELRAPEELLALQRTELLLFAKMLASRWPAPELCRPIRVVVPLRPQQLLDVLCSVALRVYSLLLTC